MYIVVWAAIAAICSAKYDSRYAHESFGRTFSPIREYGGDCSRYCLDKRPHGGELWKKGAYSCGKCKGNVGGNIWRCSCDLCQRDCELSEVMADRRCIIAPFIPPKFNVAGKVMGSIGNLFKALPIDFGALGDKTDNPIAKKIIDIAGKVKDKISKDDAAAPGEAGDGDSAVSDLIDNPMVDGIMDFAKSIFAAPGKMLEMDELAAAIAIDINVRTKKLVQCMDAKIAAFQNKVYDWSVKEAFSSYQIAGLTDEADVENKADKIHDAWADHVNVIRSKFDTPDDALFVYTLLQSSTIANLMTTFTLVSTDYLKYLALTKSNNFDNRYQTTMDCYDLILNYISGAKDTMAADFKAQLKAMPCRNGFSLDKEISKWEDEFYPVYYDPIEEYKTTMEEFMNGLPSDFYEKPEEYAEGTAGYDGFPPLKNPSKSGSSDVKDTVYQQILSDIKNRNNALIKKSCSVNVLSVDHKSGVNGKYFNFDKKALDAILGRKDWSGDKLAVSNGKKVVVWRNPNGGSKGDAHGRYDPFGSAKENQFWIGQKVTFVDC